MPYLPISNPASNRVAPKVKTFYNAHIPLSYADPGVPFNALSGILSLILRVDGQS